MATKREPSLASALTADEFRDRFERDWARLDNDDRWEFALQCVTGVTAELLGVAGRGTTFTSRKTVRADPKTGQPDGCAQLFEMIVVLSKSHDKSPIRLERNVAWKAIADAQPKLDKHANLSSSKPDIERAEADERLFDNMTIQEIAVHNGESYTTTKKRRDRLLAHRKKQTAKKR